MTGHRAMHRALSPTLFLLAACCLILFGMLVGCAGKKKLVKGDNGVTRPAYPGTIQAWESFLDKYCLEPKAPAITASGVLYVTRPLNGTKRTNRMTWRLWGNLNDAIRMDVLAGIGSPVAHIYENASGLTVYYPQQKTAYFHPKPDLGAMRLGMPIPFSLRDLASLLAGDWSALVNRKTIAGNKVVGDDLFQVDMKNPDASLQLRYIGRPVMLRHGQGESVWTLETGTYPVEAKGTPQPGKYTFTLPSGERGILRLRQRELKLAAWKPDALKMDVPENVKIVQLHKMGVDPSNNMDK